jgi:hypothetical protein
MQIARVAALAALAIAALGTAAAEEPLVVGNVRLEPAALTPAERDVQQLVEILNERYAPAQGSELPSTRLLSATMTDTPGRYRTVLYDYATDKAFEVFFAANGTELERKAYTGPELTWQFSQEEFNAAAASIIALPEYREGFASGDLQIYEPMPPNTVDAEGRRLVNVGVMSTNFRNRGLVDAHEIISVHLATGEVKRYEASAPPTAQANRGTCGAISSGGSCNGSTQGIQVYNLSWPAENPLWTMRVMRPEDSQFQEVSVGTGIRLDDVAYKGDLVLRRADVPVLNVRYQNNGCGPYRDWLDQESCFNAPGATNAGVAGFAITTGPPQTICQSFTDQGNHRGVAIYDEGESLFLLTETSAGWYRYIMGWRFYANGDIEPYFDFGSHQTSCICIVHRHHVWWRFDWAIDGVGPQLATGLTNIEHSTDGGKSWTEITQEGVFTRSATQFRSDYWRLTGQPRPDGSRVSYTVKPGKYDGSQATDPDNFTGGDIYIYPSKEQPNGNSAEVNDGLASVDRIGQWLGTEAVGPTSGRRTAMWYHAHVYNDYLGAGNQPGVDPETCYPVGPVMVRTLITEAADSKDTFQVK